MEGYTSEKEQLESFRGWWKRYGSAATTALMLAAAVAVGVQWWRSHTASQAEAASMEYQQLAAGLAKNNPQAVQDRATRIIGQYGDTPYAPLAALALAKIKMEQGDSKTARTHLQWVLDHSDEPAIQHIARLRLARILFADGDSAAALTLLNTAVPAAFATAYEELKGDIHAATGKTAEARAAYTKALAALEPGSAERQQLQMKLDDLGPA